MIEEELLSFCECGCGLRVTKPENRFIYGHNQRGKDFHKPEPEPQLCECGCGELAKPGNRFIHGHQMRGKNNGMRGKTHSQETKDKIAASTSKALKGIPHSKAHSEAVAKTKRGIPLSDNHKFLLSKSMAKIRRKNPEIWNEANGNMRGGNDIIEHHYIYDHSDLSKYTIKVTRKKHTFIHTSMNKAGIKIPHINVKGE